MLKVYKFAVPVSVWSQTEFAEKEGLDKSDIASWNQLEKKLKVEKKRFKKAKKKNGRISRKQLCGVASASEIAGNFLQQVIFSQH